MTDIASLSRYNAQSNLYKVPFVLAGQSASGVDACELARSLLQKLKLLQSKAEKIERALEGVHNAYWNNMAPQAWLDAYSATTLSNGVYNHIGLMVQDAEKMVGLFCNGGSKPDPKDIAWMNQVNESLSQALNSNSLSAAQLEQILASLPPIPVGPQTATQQTSVSRIMQGDTSPASRLSDLLSPNLLGIIDDLGLSVPFDPKNIGAWGDIRPSRLSSDPKIEVGNPKDSSGDPTDGRGDIPTKIAEQPAQRTSTATAATAAASSSLWDYLPSSDTALKAGGAAAGAAVVMALTTLSKGAINPGEAAALLPPSMANISIEPLPERMTVKYVDDSGTMPRIVTAKVRATAARASAVFSNQKGASQERPGIPVYESIDAADKPTGQLFIISNFDDKVLTYDELTLTQETDGIKKDRAMTPINLNDGYDKTKAEQICTRLKPTHVIS